MGYIYKYYCGRHNLYIQIERGGFFKSSSVAENLKPGPDFSGILTQ